MADRLHANELRSTMRWCVLVRLPRQPGGGRRILKEERWLPWLAAQLPVRVPEVVAVGAPGLGYPERWSVVRWLDGLPLTAAAAALRSATAIRRCADPP